MSPQWMNSIPSSGKVSRNQSLPGTTLSFFLHGDSRTTQSLWGICASVSSYLLCVNTSLITLRCWVCFIYTGCVHTHFVVDVVYACVRVVWRVSASYVVTHVPRLYVRYPQDVLRTVNLTSVTQGPQIWLCLQAALQCHHHPPIPSNTWMHFQVVPLSHTCLLGPDLNHSSISSAQDIGGEGEHINRMKCNEANWACCKL